MIDLDNQTDRIIDLEFLEKISSSLSKKDIELLVVDNKTIKEINKEHRDKDEATDVLSFPFEQTFQHFPLGIIIISIDFVDNLSKEFNHSFDEEFALLFIHGFLHLLGYDHETDNGEHRKKEEELIKSFNLPPSLIVRNSI